MPKIGFLCILDAFLQQAGWPRVSLISMHAKHDVVESTANGITSLTSSLASGASEMPTEAWSRKTGAGMLLMSSPFLPCILAASKLLSHLS